LPERARDAAADRGVQYLHAALGADPVNLADQGGRVGREVDVQRAARGALEDAVGAEHD